MKPIRLGAVAALVATIAFSPIAASAQSASTHVFTPVPNGAPAPEFSVIAPDGSTVKLSDFRGKVVLLDFWATWCGPCQVSMPGLEKIYQQVRNDGVVVLSVNTWDKDPDYKAWLKLHSGTDYHFTFVRDPAEGDHATIRKLSIAKTQFHVIGIPTMYIIDRNGKVAASLLGSGNEANLIKVLDSLGIKASQ